MSYPMSDAANEQEVCPDCGGDGDVPTGDSYEFCAWCGGSGMVLTQRASEIRAALEDEHRDEEAAR